MFKIQKRHYQRLTSNFFLSHYVHNNISTDNFATKIRSRWSIEFYAKSFQRWHNAPIIFPTCVRIIFTTYESFLSYVKFIIIWRLKEKNGKQKKKEKNISKFKERLFTESEEIFPMSLNIDRIDSFHWIYIKSFNVLLFRHRINR